MSAFPHDWSPPHALQQCGAFTGRQAVAAGMSEKQVSTRIRQGSWERVAGYGLRLQSQPLGNALAMWATHLSWPDVVFYGPTAARFHGAPIPGEVPVHVASHAKRRRVLNVVPHAFSPPSSAVQGWGPMQVTTAGRSFIDALMWLPAGQAQSLFVWLVTRERLSRADVEDRLKDEPRRWGNSQLRQLLASSANGALSPAEELAHEILDGAGIRGWQANVTISDASGIIGAADIVFDAQRLVLEVDGRRHHSDAEAFQTDRTRQNRLIAAGYRVLRFTWEDLTKRPREVVAQTRALLGRGVGSFPRL